MSGIILCALDVSQPDHERPVLRRAAQLAKMEDARLDVMTVLPDYGNSWVGSYFEPDFHKKAEAKVKEALSQFVRDALGEDADRAVRHIVATGSIYEEVLRIAKTDGASVIVLGSHRPAFSDYLLGPNAARVVRHATCSVFVVRES